MIGPKNHDVGSKQQHKKRGSGCAASFHLLRRAVLPKTWSEIVAIPFPFLKAVGGVALFTRGPSDAWLSRTGPELSRAACGPTSIGVSAALVLRGHHGGY
ncbi:hypothetical protein V5799_003801 [Amblyomma americanum]|uniref:Uncharacterized protein n=1 Tax=Amblyomma americanum TaxID=6943 RepID=A0AAQ4D7X4_AMBAM